MEERITHFPFSIFSNPMYVGSTMLFFARAFYQQSPMGILLSIWAGLIYKLGTLFEEPFTAYIYAQAEQERNKNLQQSEIAASVDVKFVQKDFQEWTVEEVANWLDVKGMGQYKQPFLSNDIDGSIASRLDLQMLKDDLGVSSLGHRFKILDLIRQERELSKQVIESQKGNKWISERKAIEDTVLKILNENVSNVRRKLELAELKLLGKKRNVKTPKKTFWVFKTE